MHGQLMWKARTLKCPRCGNMVPAHKWQDAWGTQAWVFDHHKGGGGPGGCAGSFSGAPYPVRKGEVQW